MSTNEILKLEGTPITLHTVEYLQRYLKLMKEGLVDVEKNMKAIQEEIDSRIEFKPIGRITWNKLWELDSKICKKFHNDRHDSSLFTAKYNEAVKMSIPDASKVSKRMLDSLEDNNCHYMCGAILLLQKNNGSVT